MAAEEPPVDAPFVPHPISAMPAPDSTVPISAMPAPDSTVPISVVPALPGPTSVVPATGASEPPAKRKRRILLPLAIALGCLVLVGGGVGFVAYDKATAIDRSTPAVTVQQMLTAVFVEKTDSRIALFLCSGFSASTASEHAQELVGRDAKPSWENLVTENQSPNVATVTARITLRYPGDLEPSGEEHWQFRMQLQDGWRVCGFDQQN